MKRVVTFGELLLSLSAKNHQRLVQAEEFVARYTGRGGECGGFAGAVRLRGVCGVESSRPRDRPGVHQRPAAVRRTYRLHRPRRRPAGVALHGAGRGGSPDQGDLRSIAQQHPPASAGRARLGRDSHRQGLVSFFRHGAGVGQGSRRGPHRRIDGRPTAGRRGQLRLQLPQQALEHGGRRAGRWRRCCRSATWSICGKDDPEQALRPRAAAGGIAPGRTSKSRWPNCCGSGSISTAWP